MRIAVWDQMMTRAARFRIKHAGKNVIDLASDKLVADEREGTWGSAEEEELNAEDRELADFLDREKNNRTSADLLAPKIKYDPKLEELVRYKIACKMHQYLTKIEKRI